MTGASRPAALVILSGGGFTFETKCLLGAIADAFDFVYLITEFGGDPGEAGIPQGPRYDVPSFSSMTQRSLRRSLTAFGKTFATTRTAIRRENIDVLIAVGCSHAVPMLLAGRSMGRSTIYLESITRVAQLSNTGRLVYHLRLASRFLVQWPGLQKSYPASELGTIL